MHFKSPIDSKSQDLTKCKSGKSHITHHTIHSHITYNFEVLQNIKDNNDCFEEKNISKVEQNSLSFKRKEEKINAIKRQKHQHKCFFSYLIVFLYFFTDFYSLKKIINLSS